MRGLKSNLRGSAFRGAANILDRGFRRDSLRSPPKPLRGGLCRNDLRLQCGRFQSRGLFAHEFYR